MIRITILLAVFGVFAAIGTAVVYGEGGYETSPRASYVTPEVEQVRTGAVNKLLEACVARLYGGG